MYFPDLNPVLKGLNTYYIKTNKLIEHFKGEIGNGVIYFKGPVTEGAVFFESDYYTKFFFKKNNKIIHGNEAFSLIMENCEKNNYEIYIYYLEPDEVYLWSEILMSVPVNIGATLNIKSFNGLLNSFKNNKETGYFTVSDSKKVFGIFFAYGEVVGCLLNGDIFLNTPKKYESFLSDLIKFIEKNNIKTDVFKKSLNSIDNEISSKNKKSDIFKPERAFPSEEAVKVMGDFIFILEDYVSKNKKIKYEFLPLLKKKFIVFIGEYEFLDPFAAEFVYHNGKIDFSGVADEKTFVESIFKIIKEVSREINQFDSMKKIYQKWFEKNKKFAEKYSLNFH